MTLSLESQPVLEMLEPRMLLSANWAGSWAFNGYMTQAESNPGQVDTNPLSAGFSITDQGGGNFLFNVPKYGQHFDVQAVGDELQGYMTGPSSPGENDYREQYIRVIPINDNAALFMVGEGGFESAGKTNLEWATGVAGLMTRGTVVATNRPWTGDYVIQGYEVEARDGVNGNPGSTSIDSTSGTVHVTDIGNGQYSVLPEGQSEPMIFVLSGGKLMRESSSVQGNSNVFDNAIVSRGPDDTLYVIESGANYNLSMTNLDGAWAGGMLLTPAPGSEYKPDLTVELIGAGSSVLPGEKVTVPVRINNVGNAPAVGKVLLNLWTDASDTDPTATALVSLKLAAGASYTKTMTFTVPADALAGTCTVGADVDFANVIAETDETNNAVEVADFASVVWAFGAIDGKMGHKLNLTDDDGTLVTFQMAGPGTGTVTSDANGWSIAVSDTTSASGITIKTKSTGADDGVTELASVTGTTPLKFVTGNTTDLTGMILLTSNSTTTISFTFASVADGGSIHVEMPIAAITVGNWNDTNDQYDLTAPSFGKITVKGGFEGDIGSMGSLGKMTVSESVADAIIDVGAIGNITITGDVADTIVRSTYDIQSLSMRSCIGSDFGAGVGLDLLKSDRHVTVGDQANVPQGTIKAFTIKGNKLARSMDFFSDSYISAKIGSLSMINWDGSGGLYAPSGTGMIGSIKNTDWRDPADSWKYPVKAGLPTDGPDAFINII